MAGIEGATRGPAATGDGAEPSGRGAGRRWNGAVAGLAGMAAVIGVGALLSTFVRPLPFPPVAMAQSLVRVAPGALATAAIEALGHWALPLATAATGAAALGSGAALGLAIPWAERRLRIRSTLAGVVAFVPLWVLGALLYRRGAGDVPGWAFALVAAPVYAAGGWFAGWCFSRLMSASDRSDAGSGTGLSRRYVLRSLWFGAAALLLGFANLGRVLFPRPDPGRLALSVAGIRPAPVPSPAPGDAGFDSIPGLTTEVTPNDVFYVVDEEIVDPDLDPATWRLDVGGVVMRPGSLTYEGLLRFPVVERFQTLECISNEVGGELMSTAKWAGVPLPLILERAGVGRGAVEVVFRAVGGYSDSLTIEQAMDERTLVAIGMNDRVLPRAHGFPARLLSVGTYGMKNPKWLTQIEVVDRPYQGYWERRGWSKRAAVKTGSRIDVPSDGSALPPAANVTVAGVAFAGDRRISRVEVSTDAGATWGEASLKTALSDLAWRLWRFEWLPPAGSSASEILVRSVDGAGTVQTSTAAAPHPDGASGYHAITVSR